MPARNIYHDVVVEALIADGWTITDDPWRLSYGDRDVYVDLAAERCALAAEKQGRRIGVEIHSFLLSSPVRDLQEAVGQYEMYRVILEANQSDRALYMAVPRHVFEGLLSEPFGQLIVSRIKLHLLVFDDQKRSVVQWIE